LGLCFAAEGPPAVRPTSVSQFKGGYMDETKKQPKEIVEGDHA
jgi:hypothetical protein